MKPLRFLLGSLLAVAIIYSCSKEETTQTKVTDSIKVQPRTLSNDPFFDLMYTHDTLDLGVSREGYFPFVTNYMIEAEAQMSEGSFFDQLKQQGIYACWYCGESEYIGFNNYYVPFYDLEDSRLNGILILQEKDKVKKSFYLSHSLVDQIVLERTEPFSQYWNGIMNYFDGGSLGKDKGDHFNSRYADCILTGHVQRTCTCQGGSGADCTVYIIPIDTDDPVTTECLPYCFGLDDDPGGDPGNDDGGPLEVADINNWVDKDDGGGGGPPPTDPAPAWDEFCGDFNGSLAVVGGDITGINNDGLIDIALIDAADLYVIQLNNFINAYGLQSEYTSESLMDFIGEACAVSDVGDVFDCLKCHFISPLDLPDEDNWDLMDDFDIVADCIGDADPNCVECALALEKFEKKYDLQFTDDEADAIMGNISSCSGTDFIDETIGQLLALISDNNPYFELGDEEEDFLTDPTNIDLLNELWQYSKTLEGKDEEGGMSMSIYSKLWMLDLLELTDEEAYSVFFGDLLDQSIGAFLSDKLKQLPNSAWYRIFKKSRSDGKGWLESIKEAMTVGWDTVIEPFSEQIAEQLQELGGDNLPASVEELQALTMIYAPMLANLGIDIGTDFIPVVGEIKGLYKTIDAMIDGNYGIAAFEFIGTIAGLVPIGDLVKSGVNVILAAKTAFVAFKVIKALGKISGNIYAKIIEWSQAGWKVIWDGGLKKFSFKNGNGVAVGEIGENSVPDILQILFRSIVDPSGFKNLNPKTLVNSTSGNSISGSFINANANKFNVTEPGLKSKFDDIVANGDQYGKKTENLIKEVIEDGGQSGFTHFDGSYSGNKGFDGVFIKGDINNPSEIIINESKQWIGGSVSLNGMTVTNPAQMTNEWVRKVAEELRNTNDPAKSALADAIENALDDGILTKIVTVVDRTPVGNADNLLGGINVIKVQ